MNLEAAMDPFQNSEESVLMQAIDHMAWNFLDIGVATVRNLELKQHSRC